MNKKEIIKYLEENELDIQSANASLFACDLVFNAYVDSYTISKVNFSPIFCYISYKNLTPYLQIIPKEKLAEAARKNYFEYLKNPKSLYKKIKEHKSLGKQLDVIWEDYQKNKKWLSNNDLLKTYQKLTEISKKWWYYCSIGEDKGQIIDSDIITKFAKNRNIDIFKARKIINILSHPDEQSVFNNERKDFLDICISILKNSKLVKYLKANNFGEVLKNSKFKQKVNSYIKEYFWFKTDFYKAIEATPEALLIEILSEINKNNKRKLSEELSGFNDGFRQIQKDKNKALATLRLTKEEKKDISFAQLTIKWMDQRKIGMMKQFYYLFLFIENISEQYGLKYHDLVIYTVKELSNFLSKKEKISNNLSILRNDGVFLIYEKNKKVSMVYGKEGREMFDLVNFVKDIKKQEIKGQVANAGLINKIKGRVRIVYNPIKDEFNKGEILVTTMTRVEFVSLMRKAKGIITNEGGVACHAAIISRELRIPCIVGTKIATKLLKDGDLVEMDVDNGTVKIIKK